MLFLFTNPLRMDQSPSSAMIVIGSMSIAQDEWAMLSLYVNKNICCGYSLEASQRDVSNEYSNICFHEKEIRKCNLVNLTKGLQALL